MVLLGRPRGWPEGLCSCPRGIAPTNNAEERTYGMLGQPLEVISHDAGNRTHLLNALGQPMRSWDARDQRFSHTYDTLRRPVDRTVSVGSAAEKLLGRIVYGDLLADPEDTNHIGRVYRVYDGAGVATSIAFDFKGQPTSEERQLVTSKTTQPDWSALLGEDTIADMATAATSLLDAETFSASSERDALGRVLVAISPDGSEALYTYDEGGGLQKLELKHRGSSTAETVVGDITYNARGQREQIVYGSTSTPTMTTTYGYDPLTYRLAHLSTIRESDDASLQGLHYHYDPVGNITDIRDTAQQTVYYNNSVVEAANSYVYDAVYRLIEATGREHSSEGTGQRTHEQIVVGPQPMTSDPSAMRRYTQTYAYDSVGNVLRMQHIPGSGSGWTRYYEYAEDGNRLLKTSAPGEDEEDPWTHLYDYDEHGSMIEMPHLSSMLWGHDDELREVVAGTETVYFQYAGGIRSRKYTEKSGATTEERIYLGGWEVYRKRVSGTLNLERESLHLSDGSGRICLVETKTVSSGTAVGTPVGVWRFQLGNHLGSAAVEVDGSGGVISYEEYHPYGTSAYRAVDAGVDVSAKRYRYTGMEQDEETGLGYHSARYYAPWLGRWTAADPSGLGDGVNRYAYVRASPLLAADPNGLGWPFGQNQGTPRKLTEAEAEESRNLEKDTDMVEEAPPDDEMDSPSPDAEMGEPDREGESAWGIGKMIFGTIEIASGVSMVVAGGPGVKALGVVQILHGADTVAAGVRENQTQTPQTTYTQSFATDVAEQAGVSPQNAETVGAVADFVVGLIGIGLDDIGRGAVRGADEALDAGVDGMRAIDTTGAELNAGVQGIGDAAAVDDVAAPGYRLNLGGEGERAGFIDINPLDGAKKTQSQIRARNPTGDFIQTGAEDLSMLPNGSVLEITSQRFPGQVLQANGASIAAEASRVLAPGGRATITSMNAITDEVAAVFAQHGFVRTSPSSLRLNKPTK